MSFVVGTLKTVKQSSDMEIDVELHGDDVLILTQADEQVFLDRRQRQELLRLLEEWGPK